MLFINSYLYFFAYIDAMAYVNAMTKTSVKINAMHFNFS
jgi:hypothetical protein